MAGLLAGAASVQSPDPFGPVPAEPAGVVRACVLAAGEGGAAYYETLGADLDRVVAALRPDPAATPPPAAVLGRDLTPPEADDALECSPEELRAWWCFYTETAADRPAPAGPWAFVGDAAHAPDPVGRVRPVLPFGSLRPYQPGGTVTPLDVLDRQGDLMILMRSGRRADGNGPR